MTNVLKVSDEVLAKQVGQILESGAGISLDKQSDPKKITVTSSLWDDFVNPAFQDLVVVGQNSNSFENRTLVSANTEELTVGSTSTQLILSVPSNNHKLNRSISYNADTPNAFLEFGNVFNVNSQSNLVWADGFHVDDLLLYLDIDNLYSSNSTHAESIQLYSKNTLEATLLPASSNTITIVPPSNVLTNNSNVKHITIGSNLAVDANAMTSQVFSWENDFSLVIVGQFASALQVAQQIVNFPTTAEIYGVSLSVDPAAYASSIIFTCGDSHVIPMPLTGSNEFTCLIIKVTHASAFKTRVDAIVNGRQVYSNFIDDAMTSKSIGLPSLPSLLGGNGGNVTLTHFSCIDYALSHQEAVKICHYLNTTRWLNLDSNIGGDFYSPQYAQYDSLAASNPASVSPTQPGLPGSLTFTSANPPSHIDSIPTYNYVFTSTSAPQFLKSGVLTNSFMSLVGAGSSFFFQLALPYASGSATSATPLVSFLLNDSLTATLSVSYATNANTFTLDYNSQTKSVLMNASSSHNNEYIVCFNFTSNGINVSIKSVNNLNSTRTLSMSRNSTSLYTTRITLGFESILANLCKYHIGNFMLDTKLTTSASLKQQYYGSIDYFNLPLSPILL